MGLIASLISSNGYITVNRALARLYGVETALVLGELASEYEYWAAHSKLVDGYFYSTVENIQEATTIPVKRQRAALTKLQDAGIIDVQIKGLPARRYIRINESRLFDVLSECENGETSSCETQEQGHEKRENKLGQNGQTGSAETDKLDCPKRPTNNNNITRTINKEDGCARACAGEDAETGIETGEIASHSSTTYAVESGSPSSIVPVPPSPSGAALHGLKGALQSTDQGRGKLEAFDRLLSSCRKAIENPYSTSYIKSMKSFCANVIDRLHENPITQERI